MTSQQGQLRIFFSYTPEAGTASAMLKAALSAHGKGADAVIGCLGPGSVHIPEAARLPHLSTPGKIPCELDVDAALSRHPSILAVDDLAHSNPPKSRHKKRYQDVEELLRAGIDVYSTLDVSNVESLMDTVSSILGCSAPGGVPDSVFDLAEQVELVDTDPRNISSSGGLSRESLMALREAALRRYADRIDQRRSKAARRSGCRPGEHILVCLSSAPSNAKIVRTGARMAAAFHGSLTALFVKTRDFGAMSGENKKRLQENICLAESLGASIETTYGEDVPYQISEFARLSGATKIVLGRSSAGLHRLWAKPSLTEKLTAIAPNLDIYIIPDSSSSRRYCPRRVSRLLPVKISARELIVTLCILALATAIGFLFYHLGFTEANIITVYLLGVLITSLITTSWLCSLVASAVSVLVFNYFFTIPRFTFLAYDKGYPVTFLIMFSAAILTGTLAAKLKNHARESIQAALRSRVLFETNQLLQKASEEDEIFKAAGNQLAKLLNRSVIIRRSLKGGLEGPLSFPPQGSAEDTRWASDKAETEAAGWVLRNNKRAGASTDTLSDAKGLYLAIRAGENVYGVVGIYIGDSPLEAFEYSMVLSVLGECALALDNKKNTREKERAALLAQSEQLRANLLRSISHDLRTPLTSISGNASNLMSNSRVMDDQMKQRIYTDIYEDSMWLISLVENLLAVTRLEDGQMKLHTTTELADEIIAEALHHSRPKGCDHIITAKESPELILVKADSVLIVQVIINLVSNAVKYTPPGSRITVSSRRTGSMASISVADDGPGIPPDQKPYIFDMFYTGSVGPKDSRRSLGLGLSLCKSIVAAHGGSISVSDNMPRGSVFTFTLPCEEVTIHE